MKVDYYQKRETLSDIEKNGKEGRYWKIMERNYIGTGKHRMRNSCKARRPDLTLEDTEKKMILLVDIACPNEKN